MDIISLNFTLLTGLSVILYYFLKPKFRIAFLGLLSCGFIASFHINLLGYVLIFTLVNYFIGLRLSDSKNKLLLYRIGIVFNVTQLILLRYASFTIDPFLNLANSNVQVSKLAEIIIPVGISYYTLQGIGYLFNLKMGWEKPEKNFFSFLVYITFFPKFLSGPIERSNHFIPQLKKEQLFDGEQISKGLRILLYGFFKKIAIANQLAPFVSNTFANLGSVDGFSLWILIILLPVYLYFDFSGYTDIAIGFAKLFGIDLLPNFNRPFFAENMTNFWKRFHISLSAWFSDYIFKQTMFKRRKWGMNNASIYALLLTWVLFGIWHGAGWNFMFLGFLQAVAIIYEYFTKKWRSRVYSKFPGYLKIWFGRIPTYLFYGTSLVFFFAPDLKSAFLLFSKLFQSNVFFDVGVIDFVKNVPLSSLFFMFIIFSMELLQEDFKVVNEKILNYWKGDRVKSRLVRWTVYAMMLSVLFVLGNNVQQFIYSQF
jgi:D-alanyl-lipoteichoic acid acyltransferase DltB (MBOAT superfamily)